MNHEHALEAGTLLVDDYAIKRLIGAGGFGLTYLADEIALARPVTIKEFFPTQYAMRSKSLDASPRSDEAREDFQWGLERFIDEAKILAQFDHPNIVSVYRYFRANSTAYMVLQFEEGESLLSWLGKPAKAPRQDDIDAILPPLLDALSLIHTNDFLHRDIAPDNIIVRPDETPVLIDFGAARGEIARQTQTISALVKPGYSPYEQYAENGERQGPWTDIYALAATLYHLVSGKRPPDAPSRMVKDDYVSALDSATANRYRKSFLQAIDHGLKLDIDQRPQSIPEWRSALLAKDQNGPRIYSNKISVIGKRNTARDVKSKHVSQWFGLVKRETAVANLPPTVVPPPPDDPGSVGRFAAFFESLNKDSASAGGLQASQSTAQVQQEVTATKATPVSTTSTHQQPWIPTLWVTARFVIGMLIAAYLIELQMTL